MDESYQDEPPSAALSATSSYKINPNWYSDKAPLIISSVTWIVSLCVNATIEVKKFKSAIEKVSDFACLLFFN